MRYRAVVISIVAALPTALLVYRSMRETARQFSDPYLQWGVSNSVTGKISADSPRHILRGTSDTKAGFVLRLGLINAGLVTASWCGILGAVCGRAAICVLGAGLLFLGSIPFVFSFAWLAILMSGLLLIAARETKQFGGRAMAGARFIGSAAGLIVAALAPHVFTGAPLFAVFLFLALGFVAAAAWWPARTSD